MISHEALRELLDYNSHTGVFRWRRNRGKMIAGSLAGSRTSDGRWRVAICGKVYLAHRLAWFYTHGVWPEKEIDHIDGNPANNKLTNLRLATHSQNLCNQRQREDNSSGRKGVYWNNLERKWKAQICFRGKTTGLGTFTDLNDAIAARAAAEEKLFGEFARKLK